MSLTFDELPSGALYDRYCNVTIEGAGGSLNVSTLRCRFRIEQRPLQSPSILDLKITNLRADHGRAIAQPNSEFKHITLDVGYQNNHGVIFKGNIVKGIYGRETQTDTLTTIYAADGDHAHNYATVNTTLPPGSTPNDHLNVALQAMQKYGVTKGYIGIDLSQPVYPRAFTLFGAARDVIALIARSKGATTYYRDEQVRIVGKGQSVPGGAIELNSSTGLIGMPTQTTGGIFARCLINPNIKQHSIVHIDQSLVQGTGQAIGVGGQLDPQQQLASIAADGLYTVMRIDTDGDTRGNPWYMDLAMIATTAPSLADKALIPYGTPPYVGGT